MRYNIGPVIQFRAAEVTWRLETSFFFQAVSATAGVRDSSLKEACTGLGHGSVDYNPNGG